MALERFPQPGYELLDDRLPLWRFMKIQTFTRFIESGSLYFCRADRFDDEHEGLPLEEYVRQCVDSMGPGHDFDYTMENLKADRQASFVSCWTVDESLYMWEKFAPQGVVVKSNAGLLKAALHAMPARTMVGYVRYSLKHEGFNILRFITTKRPEFKREREVRAFAWKVEESSRNPYPTARPVGLTFSVDVPALVQAVIVSPQAPLSLQGKVQRLLKKHGYEGVSVKASAYAGHDHLLPNAEEIARYSRP